MCKKPLAIMRILQARHVRHNNVLSHLLGRSSRWVQASGGTQAAICCTEGNVAFGRKLAIKARGVAETSEGSADLTLWYSAIKTTAAESMDCRGTLKNIQPAVRISTLSDETSNSSIIVSACSKLPAIASTPKSSIGEVSTLMSDPDTRIFIFGLLTLSAFTIL